uniref:Uncharacterized protein n=1 Tax=Cacopsylla melanoneura TaxID=428564 RepID=A0A8D9BVG1_9HEMI
MIVNIVLQILATFTIVVKCFGTKFLYLKTLFSYRTVRKVIFIIIRYIYFLFIFYLTILCRPVGIAEDFGDWWFESRSQGINLTRRSIEVSDNSFVTCLTQLSLQCNAFFRGLLFWRTFLYIILFSQNQGSVHVFELLDQAV